MSMQMNDAIFSSRSNEIDIWLFFFIEKTSRKSSMVEWVLWTDLRTAFGMIKFWISSNLSSWIWAHSLDQPKSTKCEHLIFKLLKINFVEIMQLNFVYFEYKRATTMHVKNIRRWDETSDELAVIRFRIDEMNVLALPAKSFPAEKQLSFS